VILVPVSQKDPRDAIAPGFEIRKIGVKRVDADVVVGKRDAAIHDDGAVGLFEHHAVHPDLAEPAERDQP
jgi:hypothetical protein